MKDKSIKKLIKINVENVIINNPMSINSYELINNIHLDLFNKLKINCKLISHIKSDYWLTEYGLYLVKILKENGYRYSEEENYIQVSLFRIYETPIYIDSNFFKDETLLRKQKIEKIKSKLNPK